MGAVLFTLPLLALSLLGFIAAGTGITLPAGTDASMIGVLTVAQLLPQSFVVVFLLMLLAGLASTLDSGLNAFSSLYAVDLKKYSISSDLKTPRVGMVIILVLGAFVALITNYIPNFGLKQLWWIFNAVAATFLVPTILSLYWDKLTAKGALYGILIGLLIGLPIFIYANLTNNILLIVASDIFIIIASAITCWIYRRT